MDARGWRRQLAIAAVLCLGALSWAGLALGGGVHKGKSTPAHVTKAAKRSHSMRVQMRMHDGGTCPHMGDAASAQV